MLVRGGGIQKKFTTRRFFGISFLETLPSAFRFYKKYNTKTSEESLDVDTEATHAELESFTAFICFINTVEVGINAMSILRQLYSGPCKGLVTHYLF